MGKDKRVVFQDLNDNAKYRFLESSEDKKEIERLVEKFTLVYPSPDLAIFKCEFASIDTFSANGLKFPSEEITKEVLNSLSIKNIDYNHDRKINIGTWLEASRDDKTIYAYGCLWKSAFPDEFEKVKSQLENGEAYISNEAYVDREYLDNKVTENPNLRKRNGRNIHFCGGAILDRKKPAFSNARVLEFCSIFGDKIEGENKMDFAEIISQLEQSSKEEIVSKFRSLVKSESEFSEALQNQKIVELFTKAEVKVEDLKYTVEVNETKPVETLTVSEATPIVTETPAPIVEPSTEDKPVEIPVEEITLDSEIVSEKSGEVLIQDVPVDGLQTTQEVTVNNTLSTAGVIDGKYIEVVEKTNDSLVISYVDGVEKSQTKYLIKEVRVYTQSEIDAKDQEIAQLKSQIEASSIIVKEYNAIKEAEEQKRIAEESAKKADELKKRREMLGDCGKDLNDEQIMDDEEYSKCLKDKKIKDLEKENAELKRLRENSEEVKPQEVKPTLEKGQETATVKTEEDVFVKQEEINKRVEELRRRK